MNIVRIDQDSGEVKLLFIWRFGEVVIYSLMVIFFTFIYPAYNLPIEQQPSPAGN